MRIVVSSFCGKHSFLLFVLRVSWAKPHAPRILFLNGTPVASGRSGWGSSLGCATHICDCVGRAAFGWQMVLSYIYVAAQRELI